MTTDERVGIILINTGTTDAPKAAETRVYLREFLSDPRVIDIPAWKRWLVLNLFILPFRPKRSAEAFSRIWTENGSPLLHLTQQQAEGLRQRLPHAEIEIGMRYGNPSIPSAMRKLIDKQVTRIIAAPLFPQYSSAANGSALQRVFELANEEWNVPNISALPPFFDDDGFLESWVALAKPRLDALQADHVLFSYHGLPERHVIKSDVSGDHCLKKPNCCDTLCHANRHCYGAQCTATTQMLAQRLGLADGSYTQAYQSRLGRDPWLKPATDDVLEELAEKGVKRLAVLCPAFVTDCLETLEEIGLEGRDEFLEAGGEAYDLIPCLNDNDQWLDALADLLRRV